MDWTPYLNTGRCCAEALERHALEISRDVLKRGEDFGVLHMPAGKLTLRRKVTFNLVAKVILHGPATYLEHDYPEARYSPPVQKKLTEHGWGVVRDAPKIVGN